MSECFFQAIYCDFYVWHVCVRVCVCVCVCGCYVCVCVCVTCVCVCVCVCLGVESLGTSVSELSITSATDDASLGSENDGEVIAPSSSLLQRSKSSQSRSSPQYYKSCTYVQWPKIKRVLIREVALFQID